MDLVDLLWRGFLRRLSGGDTHLGIRVKEYFLEREKKSKSVASNPTTFFLLNKEVFLSYCKIIKIIK